MGLDLYFGIRKGTEFDNKIVLRDLYGLSDFMCNNFDAPFDEDTDILDLLDSDITLVIEAIEGDFTKMKSSLAKLFVLSDLLEKDSSFGSSLTEEESKRKASLMKYLEELETINYRDLCGDLAYVYNSLEDLISSLKELEKEILKEGESFFYGEWR